MRIFEILISFSLLIFSCQTNAPENLNSDTIYVKKSITSDSVEIIDNSIKNSILEKDSDFIKITNYKNLEFFSRRYEPNSVDLSTSINDSLASYDLTYIFLNCPDNIKRRIINTILLKQYLFQIKKAHQGFDLLSMRKGGAGLILNEFFRLNNIETDREFINSGIIVDIVDKDQHQNLYIKKLRNQIYTEDIRLNKLYQGY